MNRFFGEGREEDVMILSKADAHHLKNVLRVRDGEKVEVVYEGRLYETCYEEGALHVLGESILEEEPELILCQGLPKATKFEEILKHGTEVGITRFIPLETSRTVVKMSGKEEKKRKRWEEILRSAAMQSKASGIPVLEDSMTLAKALDILKGVQLILCDEEEEETSLHKVNLQEGPIALFVGPEGGWSREEVALLKEHGAIPVTLGKRILRTETAGVVASFAIQGRR